MQPIGAYPAPILRKKVARGLSMRIYSLNPKQAEKVNAILKRPRDAMRYRSFGAAYLVMPKDIAGPVKVLDKACEPLGFITVREASHL
jgi:hypothetical protein